MLNLIQHLDPDFRQDDNRKHYEKIFTNFSRIVYSDY